LNAVYYWSNDQGMLSVLDKMSKKYLVTKLIACCFAMTTPSESLAEEKFESSPNKEMGLSLSEELPDELTSMEAPFEFLLKAGYREDNLNWNEAGGSINILSELKWEHLKIAQISADAGLNFHTDWKLRGVLTYGRITSGSNQDSDYNGNNRTLEFSRSNNKGGGKVRDVSAGFGKTIHLSSPSSKNDLSVSPSVGLSIHQQYLTMTDGFQTLPASGSYPGLANSYDTKWQGPWAGISGHLEQRGNWSLTATAEYHWADYSAQANWNLRREFSHPVSFVHTAKGRGIMFSAETTYPVSKEWRFSLSMTLQRWKTGAGIDKTFFSDGSAGYYPLNEVNWRSAAVDLGVARSF
jgi:hypothetical protein